MIWLDVWAVLSFVVIVSGEHTRTIQIATPTVGGLMKFAVKTVTCLGCKTPLRANNSVSGAYRLRPLILHDVIFVSWQMAQSAIIAVPESMNSTKNKYEFFFFCGGGRYYSQTHNYRTVGIFNIRNSGKICKTVDAMSTMSRVSSSGKNEPNRSERPGDDRWILGCAVHEQRLPNFL